MDWLVTLQVSVFLTFIILELSIEDCNYQNCKQLADYGLVYAVLIFEIMSAMIRNPAHVIMGQLGTVKKQTKAREVLYVLFNPTTPTTVSALRAKTT